MFYFRWLLAYFTKPTTMTTTMTMTTTFNLNRTTKNYSTVTFDLKIFSLTDQFDRNMFRDNDADSLITKVSVAFELILCNNKNSHAFERLLSQQS